MRYPAAFTSVLRLALLAMADASSSAAFRRCSSEWIPGDPRGPLLGPRSCTVCAVLNNGAWIHAAITSQAHFVSPKIRDGSRIVEIELINKAEPTKAPMPHSLMNGNWIGLSQRLPEPPASHSYPG